MNEVIYYFETVDMAKTKEVLGDNACTAGSLSTT